MNQHTNIQIRKRILAYYDAHGRDLPWRRTRNPYCILVSEVMLQQTQVSRVIEKYNEFLKKFPTVDALALAKTSDVLKVWKGLGYNRRALFLQRTAQAVVHEYAGKFPQDLEILKTLPGVGDYTARAILSFAFEQPVPMMDTNHRRFYTRVLHGLKEIKDVELLKDATSMLPKKRAYDWNQALMDVGSFICLSKKPLCETCPVKTYCQSYPDILTVEPKKKARKYKTPFRETDRYYRGKTMDVLREHGSVTVLMLKKQFDDIDQERVKKIIAGLEKDGLICIKNKRIMLPD